MQKVKSQQSSHSFSSTTNNNILTIEYNNNEKQFLINNKNARFKNINNLTSVYCDMPNNLNYVTKDGTGYIVKPGNKSSEPLSHKNVLSIGGTHGALILTKDKLKVNENTEIDLPIIDSDDQFIKVLCSSLQTFYFLLTLNGKIFIYGENPDCVLGISNSHIKFNNFTLHPNLEHVSSKIIDLKCGYLFSILRCENGDCYGSGYNCYVNIGVDGRRSVDVKEYTLIEQLKGRVKQHGCGSFHTVYLTFDGEVYGCGLNTSGQFGKAYKDKLYDYTDCVPLTKITFNNNSICLFKSVIASGYNTALITDNNTIIYCSRNNSYTYPGAISRTCDEYSTEINCGLDTYLGEFGMNRYQLIEFGIQLSTGSTSFKGIIACKGILNSKNLQYFCENLGKVVSFSLLSDIDINI